MSRKEVKCLLLCPPITDPTSGYHSLCYLDSYARAHGHHGIEIIDANIEALHYMAQPAQVQRLKAYGAELLDRLGRQSELRGDEQIAYLHAWLAGALDSAELADAFAVLRAPDRFYEIAQYQQATQTLALWMKALSLLGFPGDLGPDFTVPSRGYMNLNMLADLTDDALIARANGPFQPYYDEVLLPQLQASAYDMIGITVTYTYQLPFALGLMRMIKAKLPEVLLVMGGTEVADVYKYARTPAVFRQVFDAADICVVGDGEAPFVEILESVAVGRVPTGATNLILHPRLVPSDAEEPFLPLQISYAELEGLPTPDYRKLPWEKYLSPEPYVYYSPTRGCYWNKCTFCDYGLNFGSPTAPWRSDPVDKIVADLKVISQQARFVYFSVDVLAPATLLRMAERIVEEGIDIRWSAEIRLEKYWSQERCALLKRSGCVCISVGFESANQRILDLIDKGTKPEQVLVTIRNFTEAGIGVQMMGFTGFPTESFADAMDSVRFLLEHRPYWTFGGLGEFQLTSGAIVAREPDRFGITAVAPYAGEEIVRSLTYVEPRREEETAQDPGWRERLSTAKDELGGDYPRPFLGGIDCPHTLFYHDRYGTKALEVAQEQGIPDEITAESRILLNGRILTEPHGFDLERILQSASSVIAPASEEGRGLSHREVLERLQGNTLPKGGSAQRYFVRRDGIYVKLTEMLHRLFAAIAMHGSLGEALESLDDAEAELDNYLGLLSFGLRMGYLSVVTAPVAVR